ncbi:MAG: N-acetylmuramoyl-L-alanine amidase [Actinomycetota bacterium]|nr:N-acetylmuramoyl-L-alanine amidase [Actinomycetota bacterium]
MVSQSGRRAVSAVVLSAVLVLAVPPSAEGGVPPTVMRTVDIAAAGLLPASSADARGALRASEDGWTRTRTLCAPITFTMAGLTWRQAGDGHVDAELAWGTPEATGPAVRVEAEPADGPDPGSPEDTGVTGIAPVWTGEATCVRVRLHLSRGTALRDVRAVFLNTSGTAHGRSPLAAVGSVLAGAWGIVAPDPADAMPAKPALIRRRQWGANENLRQCGPDYAPALKMAYVHHTATGNGYSRAEADDVIRGIYAYHVKGRGYCDIAYNFLVDRFGRIYEGRYGGPARPVIGGHAMGFNTGSTGVAALGDFTRREPPAAMVGALVRLLAWRLDAAFQRPGGKTTMVSAGGSNQKFRKGERVTLPVISGHRDTGYTSCPGDRLYARLPNIRTRAQALGLPKLYRPAASRSTIEAGRQSARYQGKLSGDIRWFVRFRDSDGTWVAALGGRGRAIDARWDGTDEAGLPVPEGRYQVKVGGRDPATGKRTRPKWFTLRVTVPDPVP